MIAREALVLLVRPEGIEPPTSWFEARRSVRLSYGRTDEGVYGGFLTLAHYSMGRAGVASYSNATKDPGVFEARVCNHNPSILQGI